MRTGIGRDEMYSGVAAPGESPTRAEVAAFLEGNLVTATHFAQLAEIARRPTVHDMIRRGLLPGSQMLRGLWMIPARLVQRVRQRATAETLKAHENARDQAWDAVVPEESMIAELACRITAIQGHLAAIQALATTVRDDAELVTEDLDSKRDLLNALEDALEAEYVWDTNDGWTADGRPIPGQFVERDA